MAVIYHLECIMRTRAELAEQSTRTLSHEVTRMSRLAATVADGFKVPAPRTSPAAPDRSPELSTDNHARAYNSVRKPPPSLCMRKLIVRGVEFFHDARDQCRSGVVYKLIPVLRAVPSLPRQRSPPRDQLGDSSAEPERSGSAAKQTGVTSRIS